MILVISYHGKTKKMGGQGKSREKFLVLRFFYVKETSILVDRALKKVHFRSFAEKGRGLDLQEALF